MEKDLFGEKINEKTIEDIANEVFKGRIYELDELEKKAVRAVGGVALVFNLDRRRRKVKILVRLDNNNI